MEWREEARQDRRKEMLMAFGNFQKQKQKIETTFCRALVTFLLSEEQLT
jgi:hypothetical protein